MVLRLTQSAGVVKRADGLGRFLVKAPSINAVRRALHRAPGGARVRGRFDRETIECEHTMDAHSLARHWPIILSRLQKAGLVVVVRPEATEEQGSESDASS